MAARLVAINGPLRRSEFVLQGDVGVGSAADNLIRLDDPWVSEHHCVISPRDGRFVLTDLESHAGTFVNGIPAKQRELVAGDEVAVGNSLFIFQADKTASSIANAVQLDEQIAPLARTVEVESNQLNNLTPDQLAALPPAERMERNLSALLRITRAIGFLRDEESLPWQILGITFDVIPAERGAMLLLEEGSSEARVQVGWDRVNGPEHPVHVSQELVRRAVEERLPLRNQAKSPMAFLCVPMIAERSVVGVLYLESRKESTEFTEHDLELLAAIAGLGVIGIENARQFQQLSTENRQLRAEASLTHDMVGRSAKMREVYQCIERVAASDATVLIYGESGTGKELAARAIHKNSDRKDQPFVALNCAALTETLLESELFGHEKGAFTSAVNQKKGFLEVAEGGTIFLDEIGELSPVLQAKLLRVLQEREFVRVGGTRTIKIDVRFLAATNRDLQKFVREDRFRADLFHRLNVISLTLPPLRERTEDIPDLAEYFVARYAKKCKRKVTGISEPALEGLKKYDWPGNIRELENAMERAVVIGCTEKILAEDLPESLLENADAPSESVDMETPAKYHAAIRDLKKRMILSALEQSEGNMTEAAKALGVHANYLHRLMSNLELRGKMKKQTSA